MAFSWRNSSDRAAAVGATRGDSVRCSIATPAERSMRRHIRAARGIHDASEHRPSPTCRVTTGTGLRNDDVRRRPSRSSSLARIARRRKRLPGCYGYDTVLWCPPGVVLIDAGDERARDPRGAVLFDFGGTLDADGVRWSIRFHAAYASGGGRLGIEAFDPLFSLSDRRLETHTGIRALGLRGMIEAQVAILCTLLPDGSEMDLHGITDRVHSGTLAVIARNRPILAALRTRYRLGVVSNFTGNLVPCLEEVAMADLFDVVTDSGVLGATKPDLLPFTTTLDALGVPPTRAWMVGDNFQADIRPAQRLGMRTVWLAPADRALPAGDPPTARIASLADLPAALETSLDPTVTGRERCMA